MDSFYSQYEIVCMTKEAEPSRTILVSEFKAHSSEQLRAVEETGVRLNITRHGKTVAFVVPPEKKYPTPGEWIGSGAGLLKEGTADLFDAATWKEK